jgi:predicted metalloendopeptidase
MTHGFDDEGAKFDSAGNLKNWWAPEDLTRFQARAACIVEQFNGFKVRDLATNGKLVSGESIADLGGLKLAYLAYLRSQKGKAPVTLDGFTPEQRLFIGWARVWATKDRPEFEELMIKTNPHPLPKFRVNGPLSNMPEFRKAFGCNETDRMVRKVPCQIW